MIFNKIEEINWENIFKIDEYISWNKDIIIFDVKKNYAPNVFNRYTHYLLEWKKFIFFNENKNILDWIYSDYIVIEYQNKENRDEDSDLMNKKINIINPIKSEKLNWNRQIAEPIWKLDLDWKYYLFLYPYNWTTDEINPELWIYKWIIVNPELYFWKVWEEIDSIEDKVNNIL
jgi:hypothetical protein